MEDHQHPTTEPTPGIAEADAAAPHDGGAEEGGCCGSSNCNNTAVTTAFEEDATEAPPLEEQDLPPDTECMCDKEEVEEEMPAVEAGKVTTGEAGDKRTAEAMEMAKVPAHVAADAVAKKKRLCRYPGCVKVIKSQGHCQRHGAKAKRCKVEGCDKQAQGTHDGMCKRHWKAANFPEEVTKKGTNPPEPEGESVYDSILPMSIAYRPVHVKQQPIVASGDDPSKHDLLDPPAAPAGFQTMPLVAHLKEGSTSGKQAGWHRNAERRARGMYPVKGLSVQLEPWERQLAMIEIMLLSGGTPYANFKELAFAWGREKGFHHVLANSVCERRGEVERKKRSDCGKAMTDDEKTLFRTKLQKTRDKNGTSKKARHESLGGASLDGTDEPMIVEGGSDAADIADNNATMMEGDSMPKMESAGEAKAVGESGVTGEENTMAVVAVDGEEKADIAATVATQPVFV